MGTQGKASRLYDFYANEEVQYLHRVGGFSIQGPILCSRQFELKTRELGLELQ